MCHKFSLLLLLVWLCLILASAVAQQARLRLPPSYNMRLGALPTRFVGKGAYTLSAKRAATPPKWQQPLLQQQQQQLQQQQQQQQRMKLFQWATMGGKKYN